jgi:hypothetical protein
MNTHELSRNDNPHMGHVYEVILEVVLFVLITTGLWFGLAGLQL